MLSLGTTKNQTAKRRQEANEGVLARQRAKEAEKAAESMHATSGKHPYTHFEERLSQLVKFKIGSKSPDKKLDEARQAILDVEEQLALLSAAGTK